MYRTPNRTLTTRFQCLSNSNISQIPLWYFPIQNTEHDWQFRSEPSDTACRAVKNGCFWPRGKMLGGSHGLNGNVYMRGNKNDFAEWESLGNPEWNWKSILKYFKKTESNTNRSFVERHEGEWHSATGELNVDAYPHSEEIRSVFFEAAKEFGYNTIDDHNAEVNVGYANAQGTLKNGERHSTAKAFLVTAKDRPNFHVIKYAHVTKIRIDSAKKVTGLEFTYKNSQKFVAHARFEYILSAGAINSPHLLMVSGIGPKEHLKQFDIPVVQDSIGVGKNLQDHLIVPLIFQFHKSTAQPEKPTDLLDNLYNFLIHRKGPLTGIGTINLVGMVNTENCTAQYPDIELQHFNQNRQSPSLKTLLYAMDYKDYVIEPLLKANAEGETNLIYVELLRPKSTGEILLRSANPYDAPRILPNYLSEKDDIDTLVRGLKFQANFVNSKSFKEHEGVLIRIPLADCDQHEYQSYDYWVCYMSHMGTTVYHPVGTAKLGPDSDRYAVVDEKLKVKGIKNLRVIDASVFPTQVSGNPNAAIIMSAEKGVDFVIKKWSENGKDEL